MLFMEEWTRILNNVVSRESLLAQKEKEKNIHKKYNNIQIHPSDSKTHHGIPVPW